MPQRKHLPRRVRGVITACCLLLAAAQPVLAEGPVDERDDCEVMRSLYQGLSDTEAHQEARRHLAKALLAMPGCVRAEGRLQRARTLDGVDVFTPGRLGPASEGELQ
ncbi:MAG: hypothetical protein JJU06_20655 [Ectothiorhodospiraceae bacterium]|nr:hypothetical protein [Ectothiorhodospiraceae bacterium]